MHRSAILCLALSACALGGELPDQGQSSSDLRARARIPGSVEDLVLKRGCTTTVVKGLSEQIIAEANCISPDAFSRVTETDNLTLQDASVFPFLESHAKSALEKGLAAKPGSTMVVTSMFRTIAQQYLLHQWAGKCDGIPKAAAPGISEHEQGLALDMSGNLYTTWQTTLTAQGFTWFGPSDKYHFSYTKKDAVKHAGLTAQAFQRLWNLNNPKDKIAEDGEPNEATLQRLARSPGDGFELGASCNDTDGQYSESGVDADDLGGTCAHSVCETGAALEKGCNSCVEDLCSPDDYCCVHTWDLNCVTQAKSVCGVTCP